LARKEVWQEAASLMDHFCVIKTDPDNACPGSVSKITTEGVWIRLDDTKIERSYFETLKDQLPFEVLGYLTVRDDRYYFVGKISRSQDFRMTPFSMEVFLPYQFEMFKLDRRANFRITLPDSDMFKAKIFEHNGKAINLVALIKDVSGGGMRLLCKDVEIAFSFKVNSKIKGELYPTKEKSIQFEGIIRHLKRVNGVTEFGIMITEDQIKSNYRLTALTLTLQRKLINQNY